MAEVKVRENGKSVLKPKNIIGSEVEIDKNPGTSAEAIAATSMSSVFRGRERR